MSPENVSVVLTGATVPGGVLFGVWRMLAYYETRGAERRGRGHPQRRRHHRHGGAVQTHVPGRDV